MCSSSRNRITADVMVVVVAIEAHWTEFCRSTTATGTTRVKGKLQQYYVISRGGNVCGGRLFLFRRATTPVASIGAGHLWCGRRGSANAMAGIFFTWKRSRGVCRLTWYHGRGDGRIRPYTVPAIEESPIDGWLAAVRVHDETLYWRHEESECGDNA